MNRSGRSAVSLALVASALVVLLVSVAQSATSDDDLDRAEALERAPRPPPSRAIAHELLTIAPGDKQPEPIRDAVAPPRSAAAGDQPLPDAIRYNGERIDAPDADAAPHDGEPVLRSTEPLDGPAPQDAPDDSPLSPPEPANPASPTDGPPSDAPSQSTPPGPEDKRPPVPARNTEMRPDGDTSADPILRYASVFRPSVAPFKRFDVKDRVDTDFILRTTAPQRLPLAVGGSPRAHHDRFYGSVVLDAGQGALVSIPSVAAEARILRAETSPKRSVRFYRDGASNDFVRVSGTGVVRLNFLTEAPRAYFGGDLPNTPFDAVPAYARPRLPPNVSAAANAVLERLGVTRTQDVATALGKLVTHFRAYVAEEKRHALSGRELFVRLALGGAGACRHRAYAFVILAQALGLPTRFVANEAHAFAEAWVPRIGWRRVDLGGVSPRLEIYGRGERKVHQPGYDPFPRPDAYRTYTKDYQLPAPAPAPSPSEPIAPAAPPPAVPQASERNPDTPAPPDATPSPASPTATDPANNTLQPTASAEPAGPAPVTLDVFVAAREALRGDTLNVAGRVRTQRKLGASNVRVEVTLVHSEGRDRRRLGFLLTDDAGAFTARFPLPSDLAPGRYTLAVETAADERFQAARAAQ